MATIAARQREIGLVDLSLQEDVDSLKLKASNATEEPRQAITELEQALTRFAEGNKSQFFGNKKSLPLNFGMLGFRQSSSIKTMSKTTWEQVLGMLESNAMENCIRIKKEVDKDILRQLSTEKLALVGCKLETKDSFFYELAEVEIAPAQSSN